MRIIPLNRIFIALCAGFFLYGDIMFETVMKTEGLTVAEITSRNFFKSDRSRIETKTSEPGSATMNIIIITRLDKKLMWIINPETKTYTETKLEELNQDIMPDSGVTLPDLEIEKTGKTKKILDRNCEEVIATLGVRTSEGGVTVTQTMWLASDVPGYQELFEYGMKIRELGLSAGLLAGNSQDIKLKEFQEKVSNIYGFPMEWNLDMNFGTGENRISLKTYYTVTSYASAPINNNVFELPAEYKLQE